MSYSGENLNYGSLRSLDLSPTKWERFAPNCGDGPKFLAYIEESVIPYVESNYRADKHQRALGGQSLGGLFSLFAMYEKPNLFKRHIAINPYVMWEDGYLFRRDSAYSATNGKLPVRLFIPACGDQYPAFRDPIFDFQKQIENNNYEELSLLNFTIKGERHVGGVAEGYTRGLRWVFKDLAPTGPSGLAKFFGE